jgi:pectate lyase
MSGEKIVYVGSVTELRDIVSAKNTDPAPLRVLFDIEKIHKNYFVPALSCYLLTDPKSVSAGYRMDLSGASAGYPADIVVARDNVTIDGGTAAQPVTLYGMRLVVSKAKNVTIRHLRIRLGVTPTLETKRSLLMRAIKAFRMREAVLIEKSEDVRLENCSISWGTDETVAIVNCKRVRVTGCIISEPLDAPREKSGKWVHEDQTPHGYGCLIRGSEAVQVDNTLFAHCRRRSPSISPDGKYQCSLLVANNVIHGFVEAGTTYNSGSTDYDQGEVYLTVLNNTYQRSSDNLNNSAPEIDIETPHAGTTLRLWTSGNRARKTVNGKVGVRKVTPTYNDKKSQSKKGKTGSVDHNQQFAIEPMYGLVVDDQADEKLFETVLTRAGATLPRRDATDERIVSQVRRGTGRLIDYETQVAEGAIMAKLVK